VYLLKIERHLSLQVAAAIASGKFCSDRMPLRWSPLMGILRDVAAGMQHIHSANICHGDLSPMNILLKYDDSAYDSLQNALNACTVTSKIADFGLAITLAATYSHVSNVARGTPFYTAPEVRMSVISLALPRCSVRLQRNPSSFPS
jgi:serine/threonine protein kinase